MAEKDTFPPMQGYKRDARDVEPLVQAVRAALYAFPTLRLGQLLINVAPGDGYGQTDLFNLYDEDLVTALEEFMTKHST